MNSLRVAENIAAKLRQEPYSFFKNDCITKSLRLKRECRALGIQSNAIACVGLGRAKWFGHSMTIPVIHGWGEVEGKRIETSRPLGSAGIWDIVPVDIKPLITIRL